jgi:AcrR family transcriptional regulator
VEGGHQPRVAGELEEAMRARIGAVRLADPAERALERLRETGRAYVDFALREPGLFTVAFSVAAAPDTHVLPSGEISGPYGVLNAVLDELVECGAVAPDRREGADVGCWAMVHGFAELHVHGPLHDLPAELRDPMLESVLDLVERGLLAGS